MKVFSVFDTIPAERAAAGVTKYEAGLYLKWKDLQIDPPTTRLKVHVIPTESVLVNKLRPDLVFTSQRSNLDSQGLPYAYHVDVAADAKDEALTASHFNQLERYAIAFFQQQPGRTRFYTFVCNHEKVGFALWTPRRGLPPEGKRTDWLPLKGEGGRIILALLDACEDPLGTTKVVRNFVFTIHGKQEQLNTTRYLGAGASAKVFEAVCGMQFVVIKKFKADAGMEFQSETKTLRVLQCFSGKAQGFKVPEILSVNESQRVLVLQPVARSLRSLRHEDEEWGTHIRLFVVRALTPLCFSGTFGSQLVMVLKLIHSKNIVHRDISPSNVYRLPVHALLSSLLTTNWWYSFFQEGNLMLNDFGFAVEWEDGLKLPYAGTRSYAPTSTLESLRTNPAAPVTVNFTDDLESAVKLFMSHLYHKQLALPPDASLDQLISLWRREEDPHKSKTCTHRLMLLAKARDYDGLAAAMDDLIWYWCHRSRGVLL